MSRTNDVSPKGSKRVNAAAEFRHKEGIKEIASIKLLTSACACKLPSEFVARSGKLFNSDLGLVVS